MTTTQRVKAAVVTVSAVVMAVGTLVGFGVIGTPVENSSGGAFAANATLLTPATTAFSIWSLIYLGLAGYVVWLWRSSGSGRAGTIAWHAAVSMLLNAAWLGVTQLGWIWASVVVILVLAVVLGLALRRLQETPPESRAEAVLVDGTFGVYLGWVSVASVANVTVALIDAGIDPGGAVAEVVSALVLVVAAALGAVYAVRLGGRWSVAAAMAWALGWIAVGRFAGPLFSAPTAVTAILAGVAVLAVAGLRRRPVLS